MSFQEFLQKKAAEQRQQERRERRAEWIGAVSGLFANLHRWLLEADPDHVLDIVREEIDTFEPGLGQYRIPSLRISLGEATVQVVPVGRNSVGVVGQGDAAVRAAGRVDITDGVRKYILYRTLHDGQERWYVLGENFEAKPLDRARLEAILQDLLA